MLLTIIKIFLIYMYLIHLPRRLLNVAFRFFTVDLIVASITFLSLVAATPSSARVDASPLSVIVCALHKR